VRLTTGSGEVAASAPAVTWRRYAIVAIAFVALAWALGGEWVSARHHVPENHFIDLLGGLSFLASGIVAVSRRPGNAIGKLLLGFGFIWYLRNWSSLGVPGLAALGAISGYLGPPLLVQIMLAYPTGKLSSTFDRVVVGIVYAAAGAASIVGLLVFSPHAAGCARCAWEPALFPSRAAYLATAQAYQRASIVLAVLVVIAAWRRTYRATRVERRDLAAWWIALRLLGAVFLLGAFSSPFPARDSFPYLLWELQSLLLASLPAIIVWGLLSARLARATWSGTPRPASAGHSVGRNVARTANAGPIWAAAIPASAPPATRASRWRCMPGSANGGEHDTVRDGVAAEVVALQRDGRR
jgi:hypothetical protein